MKRIPESSLLDLAMQQSSLPSVRSVSCASENDGEIFPNRQRHCISG